MYLSHAVYVSPTMAAALTFPAGFCSHYPPLAV
jgi:hypothetical protein